METPTFDQLLNYKNFLPQKVTVNFPEFCDFLLKEIAPKTNTGSITECCYLYFNKDKEAGKCKTCGKSTKFLSFTRGYNEFCGRNCANSNKEKEEKRKKTCKEKYGAENVFASDYGKSKIVDTNRRKYGVDYPQQSKEIHQKSKQTCKEKYGVEYYSMTEESRSHKSNIKEETTKKVRKTAYENFMKNHPEILEFEDGWFTVKCFDMNCDRCKERFFRIPQATYYNRKVCHIDRCTNRTPLGVMGHPQTEQSIEELLKQYNINYSLHNRKILDSNRELDIYLPDCKIAIEINGCYWHSSEYKNPTYHYQKWKECKDKGIQLISVWEDWLYNKRDIIESIILSKTGNIQNKIYARKCQIKNVNAKISKEFLNNNHLQGNANSSIQLGLFYEDELVSIMTFGRRCLKSKRETDQWELMRFCNKLNTCVVGGSQKLFNYFVTKYRPNQIISYASHDISNGGLYEEVLGFNCINETKYSYWYINKETFDRHHRYQLRKSELVRQGADPNLTEEQIMMTQKPFCDLYLKIYDSGQSTYEWKKAFV